MLTNRWAVLALLFFARMAIAIQFQSIPPLVPLLVRELGLSYTQVGALIGLYMMPGAVLSLPGGMLGGRFGDKPVLLGSLALMGLGTLLFAQSAAFAHAYAVAYAARLLAGFGAVVLNMYIMKIVTDYFAGRELATAMGIMLSGWPLGIGITVASLGAVAAATSWQTAVRLTAGYAVLMLLLVLAMFRPAAVTAAQRGRGVLWRIGRREGWLIGVAGVVWGVFNVGVITYLGFTPALLAERGAGVVEAGVLVSLAMWVSIASVPLGGLVADRSGRIRLSIAAGSALGLGALGGLALDGAPAVWTVLYGVSIGSAGAIMTLPGALLREESRATGFGLFYTVYYALMALGPPMGGALRDATGQAVAAVLFAAGLAGAPVVALLALVLLQRRWPTEPTRAPRATD